MQSGTGVYYQAMPAVGPDGKNIMKLIPVKKVNGQFVHTQLLPLRNVGLPAHESLVPLPQNRVPTLQPTADGRFILKTPLEINTVFNSVKSQHREANVLLQSATNQLDVPIVTHNIAQNTLPSPAQSNNEAVIVTNSPQPPNTVKPPAIQSGHYLKIPSNATVRTLPASALPSSIKNRICHSSNDSNPAQSLQMVLYVSPVSSLKLDQHAPCLTNPSDFSQTSVPTSTASIVKSPEKPSKNNQAGTAPMKWVIEEREGSSAPYLIPVTSPSMSTDILKAVKQMESRFPNQCAKEPVSTDISKEMVTPVNDNALVMCNGKVYLVAKKNSQVTKDMMTNAESKLQPRKSAQSPTASGPANTSQKQDPKRPSDSKKPSDVIDLCDDEEEESPTCTSSEGIIVPSDTVSENDEDSNVIFVSYIPPKSSETETNKEVTEMKSQTSHVADTECANLDIESMETGSEINSGNSAEVEASEYEAVHANEAALEGSEAWSEKLDVVCGQQTDVTEKQSFEETVPDPMHQPKSDSELRRTFGITFDLSVSLQKIDVHKESQTGHLQSERRLINKRTLDGIRKLIRDTKIETKIKQLIQAQVPNPVKTGKRKRLEKNRDKIGFDNFSLIDADSSNLSDSLSDCGDEIQSASAEQSRDRRVFQTCQASEEKNSATRGAGNVSGITTDLLCYSTLVEPVQTRTAECQIDSPNCCSGLRKTPPRSSKGCGRVCTACPCGTKVGGGVARNSASKLGEKPNPLCDNSSKRVPNESNRNVPAVDTVVANSVPSSTTCNSASGKSGNQMTHGSQPHISKNVKDPLTTADFSTSQSAATVTCSSSSSCTQDKTSTSSKLETDTQKPDVLNEAKNVSSSAQQLSHTSYRIPSELYSVLLDPEEIKRQERIKRLKDLLQEKEAALEKLRKSM